MIIDTFKVKATREEWEEGKTEIGFYGIEKDFDIDSLDMMGFDEQIELDKEYELTIEVDETEGERGKFYDFYVIDIKKIA